MTSTATMICWSTFPTGLELMLTTEPSHFPSKVGGRGGPTTFLAAAAEEPDILEGAGRVSRPCTWPPHWYKSRRTGRLCRRCVRRGRKFHR